MFTKREDICEDYGFRFLDNVQEPAVQLDAVGWQSRNDKSYYWNNKNRPAGYLFQYTLNGSGTLRTSEAIIKIKEGEAFFLKMPGEESYYFDEHGDQAPWEFVYIMFRGEGVSSYYEYIRNRMGQVIALPAYHPAVKLLLDLYQQARNGLIRNAFMADREAFRFLCFLCEGTGTEVRHSNLTDRAKNYMECNFEKQITLALTADCLGVSQSHLSREFVKYMGEKPIHYLTKLRLEHAMELLHSTDLCLEEISASCGFSDRNYFCKVFKKYMKASPGELRRQLKAQGYVSVRV